MKINHSGIDFRRAELAKSVTAPAESGKKQTAGQAGSTAARSDSVQISDAGKALAAQQAEAAGPAASKGSLSAERIAEIRQRILDGAYNSVEVVDQVARRMLDSGDI